MLKLLKWAYGLGVRQERVRISAHLQNLSHQLDFNMVANEERLYGAKISRSNKDRLQFDLAVDTKVRQTIRDIMEPKNENWIGRSLMFPNDKHKGEK